MRDTRGNVDPRVGMLMLGVGILSVLGVLPFVLNSAERAGQTLTDQVTVLQRGASPSGNGRLGSGGSESGWHFGVSPGGVKVEKTGGVVGGSLQIPFNGGGGAGGGGGGGGGNGGGANGSNSGSIVGGGASGPMTETGATAPIVIP